MSGFHPISHLQRTTSFSSDIAPLEPETTATTDTAPEVTALTREQLRQALVHLLNVSVTACR